MIVGQGMRIWHQSFTVLEDLPAYTERMRQHARKVVRPDTEVVLHGQLQGTFPSDYPVDDIGHSALFALHSQQWVIRALQAERSGFDAFAMCNVVNPLIREIRTLVDIPVVGYGELCFHMACMLGHRFGVLVFAAGSEPLLAGEIDRCGLQKRFVGIQPSGSTFRDILAGYSNPGPVIDRFRIAAREMIGRGADVIVPAEVPLNVLLASEGISEVDGAPVVDGLAITLKMTEMMVDLKRTVGLTSSRHGFFGASPRRERVEQVLAFYGLDRLAGRMTEGGVAIAPTVGPVAEKIG